MRKTIRERRYKAGYILVTELISGEEAGGGPSFEMTSAYTLKKDGSQGDYVGNSKTAHRLIVGLGIAPEKNKSSHCVCSVGFCERDQKWFGWSHRAIYGFGVGDVVEEGDCTTSSGYTDEWLKDHPEDDNRLIVGFTAETLDDCRKMAAAFAESVS